MTTATPRTLYNKVWDSHVVDPEAEGQGLPSTLYIDLHLLHEVTSPQAFSALRERGLPVRRPAQAFATMDHSTPTLPPGPDGVFAIADRQAARQLEELRRNCAGHGIELLDLGDPRRGIVHVIAPELGLSQPGMTIVCGDSHTCSHGAFGALAFGIGTGEVANVLASQCLLARRSRTCKLSIDGTLEPGVTAKDVILAIIARIGTEGATGHALELGGSTVRAMSMEQRLTLCNMAIEAGARTGMVEPDDTTFQYLAGRPFAPRGTAWDEALGSWRQLASDEGAVHDRSIEIDAGSLQPMITYGTSPGMAVPVSEPVPAASDEATRKALSFMQVQPGKPLLGHPVDVVFVGSCTNGRLSDLRDAARVLGGRRVHERVRMLVVPGSQEVKDRAEAEGLDRIFLAAGAEWREPGCSMCLAMNDDRLEPGQVSVSTSNRNFEGRQGPGGRTLLASPFTAAASAVAGAVADPRSML